MDEETTKPEAARPAATQIVVGAGGLEFVTPEGRVIACLAEMPSGAVKMDLLGPGGAVSIFAGAAGADVTVVHGASARSVLSASESRAAVSLKAHGDVEGVRVQSRPECNHLSLLMPGGGPGVTLSSAGAGGLAEVHTREGALAAVLGTDQGDGGFIVFDRNGARVFAVPTWKFITPPPQEVETSEEAEVGKESPIGEDAPQ